MHPGSETETMEELTKKSNCKVIRWTGCLTNLPVDSSCLVKYLFFVRNTWFVAMETIGV